MRLLVIAALSALTFGLIDARPAAAATSAWECMGPAAACAKSSATSTKAVAAPTKKKKYSGTKAKKSYKQAKSSKKSYSGGGGGGLASYYWQPQRVASGGWFNPNALTAAHKTLPFGTKVRVTNRHNGRSVVVTINDRGPYIKGRVIDLSSRAAGVIGMKGAGVAPISMEILGRG